MTSLRVPNLTKKNKGIFKRVVCLYLFLLRFVFTLEHQYTGEM